jgi:hypothetical protein
LLHCGDPICFAIEMRYGFVQRLALGILFMRLAVTPLTVTLRALVLALAIGLSVGQEIGAAAPPVPPAPAAPAAPAPRAAAPAPRAAAAAPKLPDAPTMLMMVRSTLLAVDQAIRTGNYTVLRDLAAPVFQQQNTAARLGAVFAQLAARSPFLARVAVLVPQYTQGPALDAKGFLHVVGLFPTQPSQIQFNLVYQLTNGQWRYVSVGVGLNP